MAYSLGAQVPLRLSVVDATGTAVNPATATITIGKPDGTTDTLTLAGGQITSPSTGSLLAYYVPGAAGWYSWSGASTGPATAYGPDSFTVTGSSGTFTAAPLVSLAEVREHLGSGTTATDARLLRAALVATEICESAKGTGKVWRRSTWTETYDGTGQGALMLRHRPIISITSVVETSTTLAATDYTFDAVAAILYRGSTRYSGYWMPGQENITVTYVAGPANGYVPEGVRHGVLELVKHLWDTQRGGSNMPRQSGGDDSWDPRMGYTIPRRVKELWGPYKAPSI